jgi:hypothetical protein
MDSSCVERRASVVLATAPLPEILAGVTLIGKRSDKKHVLRLMERGMRSDNQSGPVSILHPRPASGCWLLLSVPFYAYLHRLLRTLLLAYRAIEFSLRLTFHPTPTPVLLLTF